MGIKTTLKCDLTEAMLQYSSARRPVSKAASPPKRLEAPSPMLALFHRTQGADEAASEARGGAQRHLGHQRQHRRHRGHAGAGSLGALRRQGALKFNQKEIKKSHIKTGRRFATEGKERKWRDIVSRRKKREAM